MTVEARLIVELKWKEQAAADLVKWAEGTGVSDKARLRDYEAGCRAGWDECIRTLKMHGLLTLKD